jgi:signal transduction histidine kinase
VELERAVDRAVAELREGGALGGARAEVAVRRPMPRVLASRVVLGWILANLLSNAAKFTLPGRPARIRAWAEKRPGERVRLWVEDKGIGLAPEHLGRVFNVFERPHGQESFPGTGIGLAIVRKGAERLGGAAGVESDGPGRGSRFWVDLQAAPQAAATEREDAAQ